MYQAAMDGNVVAGIFLLKKFKPSDYRETRAMMSPAELEKTLEKEIEARVTERVERRLREMNAQVN